jgi:hypothetical protein
LLELIPATVLLIVLKPVERELIPVDVEAESVPRALLVVLRLVDSVPKPVERELRLDDVDVERLPTALLVVLRPVESELMLAEDAVDREVNWPKFTASVGRTPAATLARMTGVVAPTPPNVMLVWPGLSY